MRKTLEEIHKKQGYSKEHRIQNVPIDTSSTTASDATAWNIAIKNQ